MDSNKVQLLALSQVKVNADNPRTISGEKFQKLINSILVFPKMMELRPVVINSQLVALGGNMRTNALNFIAKMQPSDIASRLEQLRDYQKLTSGEKDALKKYWGAWVKKPTVHAVKADTLSPTEQQQFIVKDNVSFGAWDFDALANKFDERDLGDWGMDIWQPTEFVSSPSAPVGSVPTQQPNYPADSEDDGVGILPNINEVLDNLKGDSFQSIVRDESDLFVASFTFHKEYFDLIKRYIDGVTKDVICEEIIRLAKEYDAAQTIKTETE